VRKRECVFQFQLVNKFQTEGIILGIENWFQDSKVKGGTTWKSKVISCLLLCVWKSVIYVVYRLGHVNKMSKNIKGLTLPITATSTNGSAEPPSPRNPNE